MKQKCQKYRNGWHFLKCYTSLGIMEILPHPTHNVHHLENRWQQCCWRWRKEYPGFNVDGSITWYSHHGNPVSRFPKKTKHRTTIWPRYTIFGCIPKELYILYRDTNIFFDFIEYTQLYIPLIKMKLWNPK